jgi:flavoprotein
MGEFTCRRCNHITKQKPYRVITEEAGVVLLNMVVCSSCARLAKRLGLPAVKIVIAKRTAKRNDQLTAKRRQTARPRPSLL